MSNILLIYPATHLDDPGIELDEKRLGELPFGTMSLASFLEEKGHSVKIIDGRAYDKEDTLDMVGREIKNTDCIGMSVLTVQIKHALRLTRYIKEEDKELPVVWGGIHPTLYPIQTVEDDLIDYVIHGEGEYAFSHLVDYIEKGKPSLESINGLVYKKNGSARMNEAGPPLDVNSLPEPAYHLIEISKYVDRELFNGKKVRALSIITTRGCPYRCAFCTNKILSTSKWRPISKERVLGTLDNLIEAHRLNHIYFVDDYFFGEKKRAKGIIEGLSKHGVTWEVNIRASDFSPNFVNDEYLKFLKENGCFSLRMGAESGSNRVLKILKKDITVEQTLNAVKQCKKYDIVPLLYFMIGIPGESVEDAKKTFSFILDVHNTYPETQVNIPGLFRPYPGGELYAKCKEAGFKEPTTLKDWESTDLDAHYLNIKTLPWIENPMFIKDLRNYYIWYNAARARIKTGYRPMINVLSSIAKLRVKHDFWHARIEPPIVNKVRSVFRPNWRI